MSLPVYSQTTVLSKGDTLTCFTQTQSKFLLKQSYKVKELQELIVINNHERIIYDSINKNNEDIIANNNKQLIIKDDKYKLKEFELKEEKQKTELAQKETRKQKTGKIVAIVVGVAVAILEVVLFISAK